MSLQPPKSEIEPYFQRLVHDYCTYCRAVSPRSMAINIETGAYLWWLCDLVKATRVADFGSGFSSYVLRRYAAAADQPVHVDSFDSEQEWLDNTRRFLESVDMPTTGLHLGLSSVQPQTYSVVVNDYSGGEERDEAAWIAGNALGPGGVVVFDDAHHPDHHLNMAAVCITYRLDFLDVYYQTVDEIGRYAAVGSAWT